MNIVEFARSLNLSTGTVSRALNDRPEVSAKTRRMVLEKAREVGFSRNASARQLVMGRNCLIRLAYPYNTRVLSDRYLFELARGVEEEAAERGYDLLLHLGARRSAGTESVAVDGLVIVAAPETTPDDLRRLTAGGRTPAVVIVDSAPLDFPEASYICLDTRIGVREAFRRLADLGHRRIGYIGSGQRGDRLRAALPDLMAESGLEWDASLALEAGTTQEQGLQAARELFALPSPPTALFARTDILAGGAVQAAHLSGLKVPDDVSVIGHDNIEVAALVNPPLTTVSIDIPSVAAAAVQALLATVIERAAPSVRLHGTHLIVRNSCGSAPATKRASTAG
jgi:LacI family transcriptional regulator